MTWTINNKRAAAVVGAMTLCFSGLLFSTPSAHAGPNEIHNKGVQKMAQKDYGSAESLFFRAYSWAKRSEGAKANAKFAVDYCHVLLMRKQSKASWLCPEALKAAGNGSLANRARGYVRQIKNGALMPDERKLGDSELEKVVALPGRVAVGSLKPTWCDIADPKYRSQQKVHRMLGRQMRTNKGTLYESHIADIASMLCKYPNASDWNKQTGYFVQRYINMTGASKKDAMAAIRARVRFKSWEKQAKATCSNLTVSDEASLAEKRANKALWNFFGCGATGIFWRKPSGLPGSLLEWDLDKRAEISSEIMKTYYVLSCMQMYDGLAKDKRAIAKYALCHIDARSLSRKRLEKELRAGKYNTYAKTIARETFALATLTERTYRGYVNKLIKRDKTYKKVLIDVPAKTWAAWKAQYAANKNIYETVYATEKKIFGPSKKALRGCLKPLRTMFKASVAKQRAKTRSAADAAATEGVAAVLLSPLMVCAAFEARIFYEGFMYRELQQKTRHVRGPRTAVYYAVMDAVREIKSDRERFAMKATWFGYKKRDMYYPKYRKFNKAFGRVGQPGVGQGVVKRVKKLRGKHKNKVKVTFKTVRWWRTIFKCRSTNKIQRIDSNGNVSYMQNCVDTGRKKLMKRTEKPVTIPAHAAKGIRRGGFATFRVNPDVGNTGGRLGFPVHVFKTKKKKRITAAYGAAF